MNFLYGPGQVTLSFWSFLMLACRMIRSDQIISEGLENFLIFWLCLFPLANLWWLGGVRQGATHPPHTRTSHSNDHWRHLFQAPGLEDRKNCWVAVLRLLFSRHSKEAQRCSKVCSRVLVYKLFGMWLTKKCTLYHHPVCVHACTCAHTHTHTQSIRCTFIEYLPCSEC